MVKGRAVFAATVIAAATVAVAPTAGAVPALVRISGTGPIATSPFLECPRGFYKSKSTGDCVENPDDNSVGGIPCADGTYSHSETSSGTCSDHGGEAQGAPAAAAASSASAATLPQASSNDTFMALAANPDTGDTTWVTRATSQQQANQLAMDDCLSKYGYACLLLAGGEDGCVALAIDRGSGIWQGGYGPDPDAAGADALAKSPTGQIKAVRCSWI